MRLDLPGRRRWLALALVGTLAALAGHDAHGQLPAPSPARPATPQDPGLVAPRPQDDPGRGRDRSDVGRGADRGMQPDDSTGRKAGRGAKRSLERARRGIGRFDSSARVVPGCSPIDFYFKGSSS